MSPVFLTFSLILGLAGEDEAPRKPNPIAPSLPLLTDEEEEKIDKIIDQFILYDTGRLPGEAGKKALQDFQKLGPEAIPALIRGMNKSAHIEASCPAVTIAKKLLTLFRASTDTQLLEFARENIGAGITRSPHMAVIKDLRVACLVRKKEVEQRGIAFRPTYTPPVSSDKTFKNMTTEELARLANSERGARLKLVLTELEPRKGDLVFATLASAAGSIDPEAQQMGRDLLGRHFSRQTPDFIREKLKDRRPEVRQMAAWSAGVKGLRFGDELIELLSDRNSEVSQAARQALVQLAKDKDFGPEPKASDAERAEAVRNWKAWWAKQGG